MNYKKQAIINGLNVIIEETSNYLADKLVKENLIKNGKVTIEEAILLKNLAKELLVEAADEFTPDDDQLIDGDTSNIDNGDMILTDQSGNEYVYDPATGTLTKLNTTTQVTPAQANEALSTPDDINDPSQAPDTLSESAVIASILSRK